MKTVGDKIESFAVTGINPGERNKFFDITEKSFEGKWKVIYFFPKTWTFVCPTEIVAYDKIARDLEDRDAVLMGGSTDNEFTHVAWHASHNDLKNLRHIQFADTLRNELSLANQLGVFDNRAGACLRATFIVDPKNVIQHVMVNNLDVGRNADEALRVLDAIQSGDLCPCNRAVGGETLGRA
jgi:lipoyl-dependent peroxiredoxin subunit C